MLAEFFEELGGRGVGVVLGLIIGGLLTWLYARWKRMQERRSILEGDARDTIVIQQHLVETADAPDPGGDGVRRVPAVLRMRSLGQGQVDRVIPNGHLA